MHLSLEPAPYLVCSKPQEKVDDWQRVREQTQAQPIEAVEVEVRMQEKENGH